MICESYPARFRHGRPIWSLVMDYKLRHIYHGLPYHDHGLGKHLDTIRNLNYKMRV